MSERPLSCVITTIQEPTPSVRLLAAACENINARIIIIGDQKGPSRYDLEPAEFYSLRAQEQLDFRLARALPVNHYARKNLGYLLAIQQDAPCIYETDDDNAPASNWQRRELTVAAHKVTRKPWVNVYRFYSDEFIWPRGFPLPLIRDPQTYQFDDEPTLVTVQAPIQQGLPNVAPDVDAIWRLLFEREFHYRPGPSLWLPAGSWCPFNTQSTWWWPVAYPLLYLPSFCSPRMTDIWRGFVAQRCLWELGYGLVFHAAEAIQKRNFHNLQSDFRDELPGYLHNAEIVERLAAADLQPGPDAVGDNLRRCYELLISAGYLPPEEWRLLEDWLADINDLEPQRSQS
jgi:STELLO glycosyltransferases